MKIFILCNDGSPIGVTMRSIWGDKHRVGVGGAELALLTMCDEWHKAGHDVVLFNSPTSKNASPFEQRGVDDYDPDEKCDVLIIFRSVNYRAVNGSTDLKVWWSTDQYSTGNYADFRQYVDKVVCISPFHVDYFAKTYNINDAIQIDLPVRTYDYDDYPRNIVEKVPYRFIFTSVPDRGLDLLLSWWPTILHQLPQASLVITSDYRLWGSLAPRNNEKFIRKSFGLENVEFLSAISRERLINEQLKATVHLYPCIYDELFCIAVAESMVAGVCPVTSSFGALRTTNMGILIDLDPRSPSGKKEYIDKAVYIANAIQDSDINLHILKHDAIRRFNPASIIREWNEKVFK
jgi:glycosyltransferase involved in cell wall biosynthesis